MHTLFVPLLLKFDITIKFQKEVCDMADNEKYLIRLHGKDIEVSEDVYYGRVFPYYLTKPGSVGV